MIQLLAPSGKTGLRRFIGPKRIAILVVLVALVALSWYLRKQGWFDPAAIRNLIDQYPITAPILFALFYAIAKVSALPTLPINLAAGLFWGPVLGGFYSTTGTSIGAYASFWLARSVLGQPLARRFNNRVVAEIQQEFEAHGWMFLAFIRLNPIFPTGPTNYLLALTSVSPFTYIWTTFAFNLPPAIAVAWIGHSLGTFVVQGDTADAMHTILAVSAAVTALSGLAYAANLFYKLRGGRPPKAVGSLTPAKTMLVSRKSILVIVLIGLALRVAGALLLPDQSAQWDDARAFRVVGHAFWTTGKFGSYLYMPLYPLLAGISESRLPLLAVDIALSSALIWLTYELTMALFADAAAALLAALGVAIYPQFIVFAILGLTEPMFMTLFVGAYVCWYRGQFVAAAVLATLSILTRPAIDLLAPILVVYFALAIHRLPLVGAVRQLAVYAAIYCALMAPWWLHNYNAYGAFVRLNLAAGEIFYAGNNPMNKTGGGLREIDFSTQQFDASYANRPLERDSALSKAALDYVKQDLKAFVERAWVKFIRFWRLWPYFDQYAKPFYIAMYIVTYVPIFILTLVYLAVWGVRDFWRIAPLLAFGGYLTLVNIVFVTSLRYRLPLEPFMIVFAAAALVRLARRWPAGNAMLARLGPAGA